MIRLGPLLGVAALAGCGGDGGSVNSTPVPPPVATPTPAATPTPTPTPTPTALIPASTFQTAEYATSTGPSFHQAIPAWQTGASGQGVTLGIVDSGIDTANTEFTGRIASASRDVVASRTLMPDDDHGTQVALTAAAARNNSGVMGMAWNATILMARADTPGSCGASDGCSFNNTAIAAGINLATANGAKVINLSLGGSAPSGAVVNAIAQAAAAGVVVVVSAGNEGSSTAAGVDPSNPEGFATGVRQAGNGNVIIAGSVNGQGVISSFSNRAGSEANWYLGALGEGVCCVYSGSKIKITTTGGQQFETLVSGTSFSAPQIAGAAALLFSAFPNLTATQVVDLLLSNASDAGAAGTDPIYGRGILDIASAFAPKGQTALAGTTTQVPLGGLTGTTSAAMGDAGQAITPQAVVLDGYGRAYRVSLGSGLRRAGVGLRLGPALLDDSRGIATSLGAASLGFTAHRDRASSAWSGALRVAGDERTPDRVLAARMLAQVGTATTLGFGFAQGSDVLTAQLAGQGAPAFLVAADPQDDLGFTGTDRTAMALRRQIGRTGLTFSAESGRVFDGLLTDPARYLLSAGVPDRTGRFTRFAVAADRRFGALSTQATLAWLREDRTVLGAALHPGFDPRGANTAMLDLAGQWQLASDWTAGAAWRQALTHARTGAVIAGGSTLVSNGWRIDLARRNLFERGDTLALRFAQPMRVTAGGLKLRLPETWDYATGTATTVLSRLDLTPSGRELEAELRWQGAVLGGEASASVYTRHQPGHLAAMPDEQGVAVAWRKGF
jgi:subtilisin family serine protease